MAVEWVGTPDDCSDPQFHPVSCRCITPVQHRALLDFWDKSAHGSAQVADAEDERFMEVLTEARQNPPTPNVAADLDGFTIWSGGTRNGSHVLKCSECGTEVYDGTGIADLGELARAALQHECRT